MCALYTAHFALACAQTLRCAYVKREHRAVETKYACSNKKGKRDAFNHQQRVVPSGAVKLDESVDVSSNLAAGGSNVDNFRGGPSQRLNCGYIGQASLPCSAQYRECGAVINECVGNTHSTNHGCSENLRSDVAC